MVVARGVDLIVAVGPELRIASLADVKTRCDERAEGRASSNAELEREVQLGDYKVSSLFSCRRRGMRGVARGGGGGDKVAVVELKGSFRRAGAGWTGASRGGAERIRSRVGRERLGDRTLDESHRRTGRRWKGACSWEGSSVRPEGTPVC